MARLVSMESKGYQHVYDIGVKDNHNYFANGVCAHNCMQMAVKLAGLTKTDSDHFRKGIKQKDPKKFKPWHDKFVAGCKEHSKIDEDVAEEIWGYIEAFSGYGFNLGHGLVYAIVAYMTAYLKHYYPVHFMTALLSNNMDDDKKLLSYLRECRRMGIEICLPDINKSNRNFATDGKKIVYPITAIKGCGEKAVEAILSERKENGKYRSLEDFYKRANKTAVRVNVAVSLILANTFERFGTREGMFREYMELRDNNEERCVVCLDCETLFPVTPARIDDFVCPLCKGTEISAEEKDMEGAKFDQEYIMDTVFGFIFNSTSITEYAETILKEGCEPLSICEDIEGRTKVRVAFQIETIKEIVDKRGEKMAFLDVTDGEYSTSIVVFSSEWFSAKEYFKVGNCYISNLVKGDRGDNFIFFERGSNVLMLKKEHKLIV